MAETFVFEKQIVGNATEPHPVDPDGNEITVSVKTERVVFRDKLRGVRVEAQTVQDAGRTVVQGLQVLLQVLGGGTAGGDEDIVLARLRDPTTARVTAFYVHYESEILPRVRGTITTSLMYTETF